MIEIAVVVLFFIVFCMIARESEKYRYNRGICSECGGNLKRTMCDSQGGRGYQCESCDHTVWVSWFGIDGRVTQRKADQVKG